MANAKNLGGETLSRLAYCVWLLAALCALNWGPPSVNTAELRLGGSGSIGANLLPGERVKSRSAHPRDQARFAAEERHSSPKRALAGGADQDPVSTEATGLSPSVAGTERSPALADGGLTASDLRPFDARAPPTMA